LDLYVVRSAHALLPIADKKEVIRTIHNNMILKGCVTDCIAAPRGAKINLEM